MKKFWALFALAAVVLVAILAGKKKDSGIAPVAPHAAVSPPPASGSGPQAPGTEPSKPSAPARPAVTVEEFRVLAAKTLKTLPQQSDLRRLTHEQAHSAPPAILEAGQKLGAIAQLVADQPELGVEAAGFYKDCSLGQGFSTSVRALCYASLKQIAAKSPAVAVPEEAALPKPVVDLAKRAFVEGP